ncbi:MAG: ATP-dependent DNA helicase RecG [Bacteroidales bacterium]|nr:ATP-dependent DNA helicase RecG [Bacteroidales bacterium]
MNNLTRYDIKYLTGVGPKRAEILGKELDIRSFYDMLYNFPFRYIDRSTIHRIADLRGHDIPSVQLRGRFVTFNTQGEGARRRLIGLFSDGTGTLECVWFNRIKSIQQTYRTGVEYIIFGKPTPFNRTLSIAHPEVDAYQPNQQPAGMVGVYNLTEKLRNHGFSSRLMQKLAKNLLESDAVKQGHDPLPEAIIRHRGLMPVYEAVHNLHLPSSIAALQRAQYRMKYEELFFLELHILKNIKGLTKKLAGQVFSHVGSYFNDFYNHHLQFPLTGAQKRVIKEIRADMMSGRQMNRLLQGDVGSGKTIVAFFTALIAIANDAQACIMAPTEILATQHFEAISAMAEKVGVKVALLTGSTRKKQRDEIHAALLDGSLQLLIGTHALLEDVVQYRNLGLAIIDEQHRFGVAQRARLWKKNATPPHVLVMTATPIPRTLSMTVYGDLDVSIIDELPPGRKPVSTYLRYENDHEKVYQFIGQELRKGRQAYIVYPLIEENEKLDLRALEEGFEIVQEKFPHYKVSMVHGKMKPAEKDYQMQQFASHESHILVATTVIEVGVNVPNASVMVIENAERFGLSQLHQLRGRVGRGADQSYCILMSKHSLTKETRHRLEVMTTTNDGFVVAEEDMKLRGPGDMEGTQQSGIAFNLKVANLVTDGPIIEQARADAEAYLEHDPQLDSSEGRQLAAHIRLLFQHTVNWGLIS